MDGTKGLSPVELRQLIHEVSNHLFVVTMGVDLLEASRADPERFAQALQSLRSHGLEPLSDLLDRLGGGETTP